MNTQTNTPKHANPSIVSGRNARAFPSVFVSHGAPTLLLEDIPAHGFLAGLGRDLGKPRAVVVLSAHDTAATTVVGTAARHHAVHDYYGFPEALYRLDYTPAGDEALADRVAALLAAAGIDVERSAAAGLDHGAWVPLKLMYPEADVPVVSVSLDLSLSNARLLALGRALAALREDGVLLLASGSFTHNLGEFRPGALHSPAPEYVREFSDWTTRALLAGDDEALTEWETRAPHARRAHPTPEHFLPLLVARGAGASARVLHESVSHRILAMNAFAFE